MPLIAALAAAAGSAACTDVGTTNSNDAGACKAAPTSWPAFLEANASGSFRGAYSMGFFSGARPISYIRWVEYFGATCGCDGFVSRIERPPPWEDTDTTTSWQVYVVFGESLPGQYNVDPHFSYGESTTSVRVFATLLRGNHIELENHEAAAGTVVLERGVMSHEDWHSDPSIRIFGQVEFGSEGLQDLGCAVEGNGDGGITTICYCEDSAGVVTTCTNEDGTSCCLDVGGSRIPWEFEIIDPEQCPLMCDMAGSGPPGPYSCEDL